MSDKTRREKLQYNIHFARAEMRVAEERERAKAALGGPWQIDFDERPAKKAKLPTKLPDDEIDAEGDLTEAHKKALEAMGGPAFATPSTRTIVGSGGDLLGSGDVDACRRHLARSGR